MRVIFCHSNIKWLEIARQAGFVTGVAEQSLTKKNKGYATFLDNDFKKPDFQKFLKKIKQANPKIIVAPDIYNDQDWDNCKTLLDLYPNKEIILVPKSKKYLDLIPSDQPVGYPVKNGFSETDIDIEHYKRFSKIHILGGTVLQQAGIAKILNCYSCDGNSFTFSVLKYFKFFHWERPHWRHGDDVSTEERFRLTCEHIKKYWERELSQVSCRKQTSLYDFISRSIEQEMIVATQFMVKGFIGTLEDFKTYLIEQAFPFEVLDMIKWGNAISFIVNGEVVFRRVLAAWVCKQTLKVWQDDFSRLGLQLCDHNFLDWKPD